MKTPEHLRPDTRKFYESVAGDYVLDVHHLKLLLLACESLDRCIEAREALAKHGTVFADRFGQPHARPEIGIERDSRLAFSRLLRELGLDYEIENRPPSLREAAPKVRT